MKHMEFYLSFPSTLEDVEINVNILLFAVKHELFLSLSFFNLYFLSFLKRHNAIKRKVKGKHFYLPYEPFKYIKKCLSVYHCVCVSTWEEIFVSTTIYHLMVLAYQKRMLKCRHPGFATLGWSDWPIP